MPAGRSSSARSRCGRAGRRSRRAAACRSSRSSAPIRLRSFSIIWCSSATRISSPSASAVARAVSSRLWKWWREYTYAPAAQAMATAAVTPAASPTVMPLTRGRIWCRSENPAHRARVQPARQRPDRQADAGLTGWQAAAGQSRSETVLSRINFAQSGLAPKLLWMASRKGRRTMVMFLMALCLSVFGVALTCIAFGGRDARRAVADRGEARRGASRPSSPPPQFFVGRRRRPDAAGPRAARGAPPPDRTARPPGAGRRRVVPRVPARRPRCTAGRRPRSCTDGRSRS